MKRIILILLLVLPGFLDTECQKLTTNQQQGKYKSVDYRKYTINDLQYLSRAELAQAKLAKGIQMRNDLIFMGIGAVTAGTGIYLLTNYDESILDTEGLNIFLFDCLLIVGGITCFGISFHNLIIHNSQYDAIDNLLKNSNMKIGLIMPSANSRIYGLKPVLTPGLSLTIRF